MLIWFFFNSSRHTVLLIKSCACDSCDLCYFLQFLPISFVNPVKQKKAVSGIKTGKKLNKDWIFLRKNFQRVKAFIIYKNISCLCLTEIFVISCGATNLNVMSRRVYVVARWQRHVTGRTFAETPLNLQRLTWDTRLTRNTRNTRLNRYWHPSIVNETF